MINLFYVDIDLRNSVSGVATYRENIIPYFKENKDIQLHNVVFSDKCIEAKIEKHLLKTYYLPVTSFSKLFSDETDLKSILFLVNDIKNCEKIVFHFNWINLCNLAYIIKKYLSCKIILLQHCISWKEYNSSNYGLFYSLHKSFEAKKRIKITEKRLIYEMASYKYIDHIITVTNCAKESLALFFEVEREKISIISNGLDTPAAFSKSISNKNKLRQKYGFKKEEQLIVYAGNVHVRKGIFDVAKAFNKLVEKYQNLRLLIAGQGDYEGIIKLVKDYSNHIVLLGSLDTKTLFDFYQMADIGIVPSYIEQCSYTCIEMMHNSLPLIVSNVDGLKEMVNEDCGLRIKVDFEKDKASVSQKDLLEKISLLLDNPKKAKLLAKNAKQYASTYFTAERMASETLAIYKEVLREDKKLNGKCLRNRTKEEGNKSSGPLISIVIPCYNAEKYLKECLDSVVQQSFADFEIILINDGSVDSTEQLVKNQTDLRIVYLKNDCNLGIAYSLNKGIAIAKGKYIARMDADDVMNCERLKVQIDFLEANEDYGLVGSWHNITDPNGFPFRRIEMPIEHDEIHLTMLFYNPISHPTVMMRKELAQSNPYNEEYNRCEDYELWFRLAEKTKIKNLPTALVNYRVHQNNTLGQHQKEMQHMVMELLSAELEKIGIDHTPEELLLHFAIGFGVGKRFFNTSERVNDLNTWLDKVFNSNYISTKYTKMKLEKIRKHLVENCCELINELI
ncbi:glycosyltransferase [Pedobacter sp. 22226]|uniref:glycosyltransferase n=1 Tax=Pedobacter sp. 22226 TaxID=3453894 RepID=UPI003F876C4B